MSATVYPTEDVDLLVRDADLLVTMAGEELPGAGWPSWWSVSGVGKPGTEPTP